MSEGYLRLKLKADVNGWDIDEVEAGSHRVLFGLYADNLRADAARHQADADRCRALAEYAERLAQVEEPRAPEIDSPYAPKGD